MDSNYTATEVAGRGESGPSINFRSAPCDQLAPFGIVEGNLGKREETHKTVAFISSSSFCVVSGRDGRREKKKREGGRLREN